MKALSLLVRLLLPAISALPGPAAERIVEVRFHGNYSIADAEMARLAGISGLTSPGAVSSDEIVRRLEKSGQFDWVRVEKRYLSMTDTERVVLLVTVREKEPVRSKFMFFPILSLTDEYGFTYGLRVTAIDLLGAGERISMPLSWGGERQAAIESRFDIPGPIIDSFSAGAGLHRKENPHFKIGDFRRRVWGSLHRRLGLLDLEGDAGWSSVDFGSIHEDFTSYGAGIALDTRDNVILPRDAVYAGFGWERMAVSGGPEIDRYKADLRGYKRLFGQAVLAGQTIWHIAGDSLPVYRKPFLGGAATLRGYEPGEFVGDNLFLSSVELRLPVASPRAVHRSGISFFFDLGAAYDRGTSFGGAEVKHGAGLGFFFFLAGLGIKADLAYDLNDSVRLHFGTGFRF
ncbi:MAG: hypothetical protein FJW35_07975 [Acidobacteria bacterium]|nr:hypothetical protein [Acidobacteriota bacterium]